MDGWQARGQRQRVQTNPVRIEERISSHIERIDLTTEVVDSCMDVLAALDRDRLWLDPELTSSSFGLLHLKSATGVSDVGDDRQTSKARNHLPNQLQPLPCRIGVLS